MYQAVFTWHNLYKRAKIEHTDNWFVAVNCPNFGVSRNTHDPIDGGLDTSAVRTGDHHRTIVFDVDFGSCFSRYLLDDFAALTNDFADLVRIYLN